MSTDSLKALKQELEDLDYERVLCLESHDSDRVAEIDQEKEDIQAEISRLEMEAEKGAA